MLHLFQEGGWGIMSLLTINLIVLIVAIWKAPRYVKNLGLLAWGYTLCYQFFGLMVAFDNVQAAGGISQAIWCGALKIFMIPILYAAFIYTVSVIGDMIVSKKK